MNKHSISIGIITFLSLILCHSSVFSQNIGDQIDYGGDIFKITSFNPKECKLTHFGTSGGDVSLPSRAYKNGVGYSVTSLGPNILGRPYGFGVLNIPTSVRTIEDSFSNVGHFSEINIPDNVKSIDPSSFMKISTSGSTKYIIDRSGRFPQAFFYTQFENTIVAVPKSAYERMCYSQDGQYAKFKALEVFGLNLSIRTLGYGEQIYKYRKYINSSTLEVGESLEYTVTSLPTKFTYEIIKGEDIIKLHSYTGAGDPLLANENFGYSRSYTTLCSDNGYYAEHKVTALKEGEAIIRYSNKAGETVDMEINVVKYMTSSISLPKSVETEVGVESSLDITLVPQNALRSFKWVYFKHPEIGFNIDKYGNYKADKAGTIVLAAVTTDGTDIQSKSCLINFFDKNELELSEWLEKDTAVTAVGYIEPLSVKYKGGMSEIPATITFENNEIIKLNAEGKIEALKKGVTKMIVTSNDNPNLKKEVIIRVYQLPESMKIDIPDGPLFVGDTVQCKLTIMPDDAEYTSISWHVINDLYNTSEIAAHIDSIGNLVTDKTGKIIVSASVDYYDPKKNGINDTGVRSEPIRVFNRLESISFNSLPAFYKVGDRIPHNVETKPNSNLKGLITTGAIKSR